MNITNLDIDQIREKAYYLWEEAGKPDGRSKEFWDEAEKILANQDALRIFTCMQNTPPVIIKKD